MLHFRRLFLRSAPKASEPVKIPLNTPYFERYSKHRNIVPLYSFSPEITRNYIAPDATVVGEVSFGVDSIVWGGAVIRGDLNSVRVCDKSSIGEKTVILTVSSLPTGVASSVDIGNQVFIGPRCTLVSCTIDDYAHVGAGSVILEGARLENGCMVAPGSVVPPGRLIPAKQLWAGNPVKYVKEILEDDELAMRRGLGYQQTLASMHFDEIEEYSHAHMHDTKL